MSSVDGAGTGSDLSGGAEVAIAMTGQPLLWIIELSDGHGSAT